MSRTITIDIFNPASIDAAVKEIRDYADWVKRKTDELRERIAYFIAKDASAVFNSAVADDLIGEGLSLAAWMWLCRGQRNMTLVIANGEDAGSWSSALAYYNGGVRKFPIRWALRWDIPSAAGWQGERRKGRLGLQEEDGTLPDPRCTRLYASTGPYRAS